MSVTYVHGGHGGGTRIALMLPRNKKPGNVKRPPYIMVPKAVVLCPRLYPTDKLVYCIIASHYNSITGQVFPSIGTIAKEANLNEGTVKQCRRNLRRLGLIKWKVNRRERASCRYELPLLTGAIEEQEVILESLRSGEKLTRTHQQEKSPLAKRRKPTGAKVEKPSTNKKNERKEITTTEPVVAVRSLPSFLEKSLNDRVASLQKTLTDWGFSLREMVQLFTDYPAHLVIGWAHEISHSEKVIRKPKNYLFSMMSRRVGVPVHWSQLMKEWIPLPEYPFKYFKVWREDIEYEVENHGKTAQQLSAEGLMQKCFWWEALPEDQRQIIVSGQWDEGIEKWEEDIGKAEKLREDPELFFLQLNIAKRLGKVLGVATK